MGKLIPNVFNLAVVIFVALGSTACSYGMAIIGCGRTQTLLQNQLANKISSTIGQPSFYRSLHLAQQGEPGYGRTAQYIGAYNGKRSGDHQLQKTGLRSSQPTFEARVLVSACVGSIWQTSFCWLPAQSEDINAQFGEKVAIHYYGATQGEQAEMERGAQQDEEEELRKRGSVSEKTGGVQQGDFMTAKA
ncbi:hypothetical protein LTR99_011119 [Exophiala xenobiotica]|uniref:Uncharacterized protein n=1 Tax=Vermiconidia calcicola TaxID=1690605 RepID=A0AAV9PQ55_9PEZI|nr:hypothetical protein LTR72_011903 [Exophiala xenobiotica]KAK5527531.1 hypothetical protein LTR25_011112 [Vermiconidia calcicola]KAK5528546.1 hypothetical protein LTR23_010985 [Chaetothyriales sp. CCFEE 6169]KAK5284579.1 hypothetical protein LTR14_011657 [Exophiala xenobiotica]KAK5290193.1 hypothetical protein LTR99_011119 [Exophiala xenobiotica]